MRYKFKIGSRVRFSLLKHLPGRKSCSRYALAKSSVLLPLTLLSLLGATGTGNIFAASLKHEQQTKKANHAEYLPMANTPVPTSRVHQRERTVTVHTGDFEPASIAKPGLENPSRNVQTGVFEPATKITNQALAGNDERPALVGLFDLPSDR